MDYDDLMSGVAAGETDRVRELLITHDANFAENHFTLVHMAAQEGQNEMLHLLAEYGADLDADKLWGITPLMNSVAEGNIDVIQTLLNLGANVNLATRGGSPIRHAAKAGREEILRILIKRGADVNLPDGKGRTALSGAMMKRNEGIVRILLRHGAKGNAPGVVEDTYPD